MRSLIQLAATLLLTGATLVHAQITNPDTLVGHPPRNPAQHGPEKKVYDLQWIWQYVHNKPGLDADGRYRNLLNDNLRAPQAFWSAPGSPLADAARAFLAGSGSVSATDNRFLTVAGCVVDNTTDDRLSHCSPQRGLLWLDLRQPSPVIVFAALRWNEQSRGLGEPAAPYTLWVFPSGEVDTQQLPTGLHNALNLLVNACPTPTITSVILVEPSGTPHILGTLQADLHPTCTASRDPS